MKKEKVIEGLVLYSLLLIPCTVFSVTGVLNLIGIKCNVTSTLTNTGGIFISMVMLAAIYMAITKKSKKFILTTVFVSNCFVCFLLAAFPAGIVAMEGNHDITLWSMILFMLPLSLGFSCAWWNETGYKIVE